MIDINDVIVVEEVKAFKASDGSLHESSEKALKHMKDVNFETSIMEITRDIAFADQKLLVREFLKNNKEELKKIFERA